MCSISAKNGNKKISCKFTFRTKKSKGNNMTSSQPGEGGETKGDNTVNMASRRPNNTKACLNAACWVACRAYYSDLACLSTVPGVWATQVWRALLACLEPSFLLRFGELY